jgi:HAD superfamily hydrolase (TIGR01450 family)
MARIGAVLIDIDGVLTVSWQPLEGAVAALRRLRAAALPLALVTNTTSRTRASIAAALAGAGFPVTAADILTAPVIAAAYLAGHYPGARCLLLNDGDIGEDLAGVTLAREDDPAVDVVLTGGAGPQFSYQALNRAFGHLQRGARLVAMHRGLYWRTAAGLQLDSGAFVAGLEQAAGTEAEVVGKPAPAFFAAALAYLTSRTTCSPPSAGGSPGRWSRRANTCPALSRTPAARPTMSSAPSPTCRSCWAGCRELPDRHMIILAGGCPAGRPESRPGVTP